MNPIGHAKRRSLRLWLPALVILFALAGGVIVFVVAERIHRTEFEREFTQTQLLWAARVQSDVERWVQRDDLEMVETIFGELGLFPEIRAALYLDGHDVPRAATRRALLHRPLDERAWSALGVDSAHILPLLRTTRESVRTTSVLIAEHDVLIACLPTAAPLELGQLDVEHSGLILLVYEMRPARVARHARLQRDFVVYFTNLVVLAGLLGLALHFLIARRLERLESAMEHFAAARPLALRPDRLGDEISQLVARFSEMAAAVNQLNTELERRVQVRTQQLEDANRELAGFSYSMSHDLRTPLRSINGFSYALQRDYASRLDARGIEHLNRVRGATEKMGQLIDDMVRLIHISRVELCWVVVDLSALAARIIDDLRKREPARTVEFVAPPHCVVRGDGALLRILLENALDNAWKYSAAKSVAKIEFGRTGEGENVVFFVRDNGCGLEMQYVEKLFNAFQRLHDGNEFPGTGIGLACVRRIVQRHGGRAWIEGAVNEGTTLFFTLPQTAPALAAARDTATVRVTAVG